VLQYFDENFNIDGSYGELKTGALVTDWEALAKTMGTSGLALAGAYAVYRRRRLEYLAQLRSGDANALEALFEENFGANRSNPASPLGNEGELEANPNNTPLPSATPPNNNDVWQDWGKNKGLPASGATLAALYALWIKRKSSVKPSASKFDDFFQSFFSSENPPSYNRFNQSVYQGVYRLTQEAKSAALADFETKNPAPTPPVKSQNIVDYETQAEEEAQYQTDLATYNQRKTEVLNNAAETYKGWSQAIYAWWNHAYQKANEAKQWVANLGQAAAQAHRTLQEEQNAKTESFKLTLQQLTQAYDPNELSALLNENFVESKPQAKLNLKTLKQQLENLKAAKVDNDTWVEYRDNYFHAQGYGGNYRYGYTKYTYMPNRERWEHRNAGRPDDSKAQKEFKYFYDRQIYQTQQQIKLAEAQEFNQNIKILSGESWLSEIEHFDSKTSAEEKFPDIQKSAEHVALEKQVQRLTLEQKTAYDINRTHEVL
jgi:hypothetical protein